MGSHANALEHAATRALQAAHDRKLTIAVAESCTGGLLASLLTDVDGLGHVFDRGFVVYSIDAKCAMLSLKREWLESCDAVSRGVAVAMAEAVLERSEADVTIAITGFAGPGGPHAEEGLLHLASARRGGTTAHREGHFGAVGRTAVREAAVKAALAMLDEAISEASG